MIPKTKPEWIDVLTKYRRAGMSRRAIVEALGCPPYTVVKHWSLLPPELRAQQAPVRDTVFEFLDNYDGDPYSLTAPEIAAITGINTGSVLDYRRVWKRQTSRTPPAGRCTNCDFIPEPNNPLIDSECFLCWLDRHGIAPLDIAENGEWVEMIALARKNGNATITAPG